LITAIYEIFESVITDVNMWVNIKPTVGKD